jgi:DNA-binding NtrC family response regulator
VVKIELPSLSRRREDIPLLVEHFLERFSLKMNKRIGSVSPEVMDLFLHYSFPGNIREMENALEHAFVLCQSPQIKLEHLPEELVERAKEKKHSEAIPNDPLEAAERQALQKALESVGGNRKKAAKNLGISYVTLWRKMRKMNLLD